MNYVIGIIIGALLVLFVPLSIEAIVGVVLIGIGIYVAPDKFLIAAVAALMIWLGFKLLF